MFGINLALNSWSLPCFLTLTTAAVCSALAVHRFGLPLTFRSCFYPILGAYTWGWMGDVIDGLAIVVMMLVVCTSLCTSSEQIIAGLVHMGFFAETPDAAVISYQKAVVWVLTFVSVGSVMSGLHGGIRIMSLIAIAISVVLTGLVFAMDDTKFLLNVQVQEVGYFFQYNLFQLNSWTDAFGQLRAGSGRAIDGKSADATWMEDWTLFYQTWSIAQSGIFGIFVGCLSRGRTLGSIVMYCLVAPSAILLLWFCIWGGIGLRQARQALEIETLGMELFNNSGHFLASGSELCFDVPQEPITNGDDIIFNHVAGVTPVCLPDWDNMSSSAFNVFYSFQFPETFGTQGLGPVLTWLYFLWLAMFSVALSDSTSFIIDRLASNGRKNNHWARRMLWATSVCALTITSLSAGSSDANYAIDAAIIVGSFPMMILLFFMLQSIWLMYQAAAADQLPNGDIEGNDIDNVVYTFPDQPEFAMPVYGGVFNIIEFILSLGKVNAKRVEMGMHRPSKFQLVEFVKGLLFPFISLKQVLDAKYPQNRTTNAFTAMLYGFCYLSWIGLVLASRSQQGWTGLATTLFVLTGLLLANTRFQFRSADCTNIRSNPFADLVTSLFLWPQVLTQMRIECVKSHNQENPVCDNDRNEDEEVVA